MPVGDAELGAQIVDIGVADRKRIPLVVIVRSIERVGVVGLEGEIVRPAFVDAYGKAPIAALGR